MPELSIVVVSYNVKDILQECLASVIATCEGLSYEVIVVDNDSKDRSAEAVRERFPGVTLIESKKNLGFARANNLAFKQCRGTYVLLLNPDVVLRAGAVGKTLEFIKATPDAGIVGCRLLNRDGTPQRSVFPFPSVFTLFCQAFFLTRFLFPYRKRNFYFRKTPVAVDYVSGAYFMVRRSAVSTTELLNPAYFMYSEEKDFALRIKRTGYRCYFLPSAEAVHYGECSSSQTVLPMFIELQKSQIKFFKEHFKAPYRELLVWSWFLNLLFSSVASLFAAGNRRGYKRLVLFWHATFQYPIDVWRVLYRQPLAEGHQWLSDTVRLLYLAYVNPRVKIRLFDSALARYYYEYFTARHPRYLVIRQKTFCVALLELPGSFDHYMQGKRREYLRRMKNRALREGYAFRVINPHDYLDDMLEINRSLPTRQGRPMEENYLDRAQVEKYFKDRNEIFALFGKSGKLRAYAYVPLIGDVCLFDRLLGHAEDLEKGIMYLLLSEVIRAMIERKQSCGTPKWVEYDTFIGGGYGIRYFKEKLGFRPYRVKWILSDQAPREHAP